MFRIISLITLLVYIGNEFFFQTGSHELIVFLFLIWFVSIFLCPQWNVGGLLSQKGNACIYLFLVFYFISTFYGSDLYKASTATLFMVRVFAPVLMYDILRKETYKTRCVIVFVLMLYVLWYAFKANSMMVKLGSSEGLRGDFIRRGEDDYYETLFYFIYTLPFLVPTLVFIIKQTVKTTRNRLFKIALIILIIFLYYIVLHSLFMTAIILTTIGVIMAFVLNRDESIIKTMYRSFVAVAVGILGFYIFYGVIKEFAGSFDSTLFLVRIEEVRDALSGNMSVESDLAYRNDLRMVSLNTFFSNPLFGANHLVVGKVYYSVIGNHAQWFDDLARYGIFAIFIFIFLINAFRKQYQDTKIMVPVILYLIIGLFNPILHPITSISIFVLSLY